MNTPDFEKFRALWKEAFGEDISLQQAQQRAHELIALYEVVLVDCDSQTGADQDRTQDAPHRDLQGLGDVGDVASDRPSSKVPEV